MFSIEESSDRGNVDFLSGHGDFGDRVIFESSGYRFTVGNPAFVCGRSADGEESVAIYFNENWALIEGILISRKLAVSLYIDAIVSISRRSSRIKGMYLNGETFCTRTTDLYLGGKYSGEMPEKLEEICQIHFLNRAWMTRQEPIREKYLTILPEISDERQKMWHLLTEDISDIQQDYAKMFGAGEKVKKQ